MKKIKAILFDMDGVLIEAKDWHYSALNRAIGLFGMEISHYDHLVTYDGLPTRKKLEMLSLERGLPRKLHDFISTMKQQYTMQMVHSHCKPKFVHEYALAKLKQMGYRMVVCSNAVRDSVETMLSLANLTDLVEFQLSNEDIVSAKPDPEIYNLAISRLGLKPEECLILEDNENGIRSALASGAHLLRINSVEDTNFQNIMDCIHTIEEAAK